VSKKKRNRRPTPAMASPPAPATATAVADPGDASGQPAEGDATEGAASSTAAAAPATGVPVGAPVDADADAGATPPAARAPATSAPVASDGWVPHESGDIRGVLIQVGGGRLLLPNATIAEVLSYAEPESGGAGADWLLGRLRWRGWQLPLVAFSRLAGIGEEQPGLGSKVIVLKALGGDRRIPYFAILTQGFPRLVTVARSALEVESGDDPLPLAIQARVRLNDEPALLPDLLQVERMLQAERESDAA
jgi:chemosensory pili system protein ChpC